MTYKHRKKNSVKKLKEKKLVKKKTFDKMKRLHCANKRIVKNVSAWNKKRKPKIPLFFSCYLL